MSTSTAEATLNPEPPEMSADGYRAVLSRPHFRNLYLGEVVSLLGDWFNTVAVYTLVQAATDRAAAVSAVLVSWSAAGAGSGSRPAAAGRWPGR